MTDDELRGLVRAAVARHLGRPAPSVSAPAPIPAAMPRAVGGPWAAHPSHFQHVALVNTGDACVIEPAVACNHCGYCRSHGH